MLADALVDKYGYAQGLTIVDGEVKDWPSEWPAQPGQGELDAIAEAYAPTAQWKEDMALTDNGLSRFEEDVMDIIGVANFPQDWQDKHSSKKSKRAEKPV